MAEDIEACESGVDALSTLTLEVKHLAHRTHAGDNVLLGKPMMKLEKDIRYWVERNSIDCSSCIELSGWHRVDQLVGCSSEVHKNHCCLLVRGQICEEHPVLHVSHVAAKTVLVIKCWIPVGRLLVDVVRLNSIEAERVTMTIASMAVIHHGCN